MAEVIPVPSIEDLPLPTEQEKPTLQDEPAKHGSHALTPPASDESNKSHASNVSELSDLDLAEDDDDDDDTEIEPDHYYEGGRIPVFKPTMDQFRSFKKFVDKIDKYGMKSGIVKVIPPKEWRDSLPALDEAVKTIKVKNPITQEFSGTHGTYTQANIEKQRSYNLPQWKGLTEESQHQPPARRGEKRKNQEKTARTSSRNTAAPAAPRPAAPAVEGEKRKPGRPRKVRPPPKVEIPVPTEDDESKEAKAPPTPTSPSMTPTAPEKSIEESTIVPATVRIKKEAAAEPKQSAPRSKGRQPKTVAERRKYNRAETAEQVDEAAFENFDYRFYPAEDDFTPERCAELEALYWRTLTFAAPMYGADMPGSLFNESTTSWNVAKLENVLDVLGQKVPGVNTAYLYLGMWKATFAWHLEDVDLYSINYIHFGAPKQWYSISQEDARRFENAMKSVWPNDAKHCSQFLRHKTYLISPALLQSQFNIKVNKLVHYEGEFVITFPYGYHSGYNMGYNCAESVNFATEQWLDFGKIAKKCDCEADSVWIDVAQIERRLRGEPTPEYIEETDDEDDMEGADHLPSPPASLVGKTKGRKRKRADTATPKEKKVKKIKIRIRTRNVEPCVLCPNDLSSEPLLPTDTGRQAHLSCALYTPETYISDEEGIEKVYNVAYINKGRLDLKCSFCRSKKGACFQCSSRKCTRSFHATCAAPAGVQVEHGPTPVYGEDGTEYVSEGYDFRCRFHRPKRPKNTSGESLESNSLIRKFARSLKEKDVVQAQFLSGDIFAGTVVANRPGERTVVIDILPEGDRVEVEWRWLLALDPADSQLPKPSADAKPLPEYMSKQILPDRKAEFGPPQEGDMFNDPTALQKWAEFNTAPAPHNPNQEKIDFDSSNKLWYYLGKTSTEAKPQYTEDPSNERHNPASLPKEPSKIQQTPPTSSVSQTGPQNGVDLSPSHIGPNFRALNAAVMASKQQRLQHQQSQQSMMQKPYQYKPRITAEEKQALLNAAELKRNISTSAQSPSSLNGGIEQGIVAGALPKSQFPTLTSPTTDSPLKHSTSTSIPPNPYQMSAGPNQGSGFTKPFQPSSTSPLTFQHWTHPKTPRSNLEFAAPVVGMHGTTSAVPEMMPPHANSAASGGNANKIPSSAKQQHAQRISKYPYLRQSFCRRDEHYRSPYPPSGGFSEPYVAFLPQNRPIDQSAMRSAPFYIERPIPNAHAYSRSFAHEGRLPSLHQDIVSSGVGRAAETTISSIAGDITMQPQQQLMQHVPEPAALNITHAVAAPSQ